MRLASRVAALALVTGLAHAAPDTEPAHPATRSVAFLLWTLEEQGLLGSEYFAKNPIWPLSRIVGGINLDSDHMSLAKVSIPMLYPDGGFDLIASGTAAGQAVRDAYRQRQYHQSTDEFDPAWDLSGPIADLAILRSVGERLAESENWPNWVQGNEFRAIRDASRSR